MSWTDERVETLKRMWAEGQSASQIAKELGGVTRNAVIGKVHRLGLSNRNEDGAADPAHRLAFGGDQAGDTLQYGVFKPLRGEVKLTILTPGTGNVVKAFTFGQPFALLIARRCPPAGEGFDLRPPPQGFGINNDAIHVKNYCLNTHHPPR